ncbi:PTS fructose transporter subunit IIC [Caproiciproducens sp. CPB-2]|uniref:PTS fructose transporter subunit IIC n=1 Tax=Caproiciproducens sp. CPB-2 TaxID=3030017 RepID=UPI0023DC04F5|nr:fructose-specific PTS transporter subunit EIIC [Caproiciproducens sp. CPB-2]MDF1493158.1 fructose-specific PTS transporter subunit EIIC [Caproiciproducens sp. CPB-2]
MKKIIAITSCPTGIAHTYMAAESLEKKAKELGYEIKVETQGASGVKNALTAQDVAEADAIILAVDKGIDESRFAERKVLKIPVAKAIKDAQTAIEDALADNGTVLVKGSKNSSGESAAETDTGIRSLYKHIMSGVSYMLPVVVAGGIILALSFAFGIYAFKEEGSFAWALYQIGGAGLGIMVPVLSAYIAYSIADKGGFAAGLIGGILANNIGAGFLGGLLSGLMAGYVALLISKYVKVPKTFAGIKDILILPIFSTLITGLLMLYLVGTPIKGLSGVITQFLTNMSGVSAVLLGIIFGLLYFDLGGPFSKVLYAFAIGVLANGVYEPMAAVMVCGMVPPIGIAIATFLRPKLWDVHQREAGKAAVFLGLSYITEGAIPFAAEKPLMVLPSCMLGSAVGAIVSMLLHVGVKAPHGGIFLLFIPNVVTNVLGFLIALLAGSLVTALMLTFLKSRSTAKQR